jgi:hypothetical protein
MHICDRYRVMHAIRGYEAWYLGPDEPHILARELSLVLAKALCADHAKETHAKART